MNKPYHHLQDSQRSARRKIHSTGKDKKPQINHVSFFLPQEPRKEEPNKPKAVRRKEIDHKENYNNNREKSKKF